MLNKKFKTKQSNDHVCDKVFLRSLRKEKERIIKLAEVMNHQTKVFQQLTSMVHREEEEEEFSDDDPEVCYL